MRGQPTAIELTGVQSISAAESLRKRKKRQDDWPFIHIFPPPTSTILHAMTLTPVALGALHSTVTALTYQVPGGMRAFVAGILQDIVATSYAPGDVLWSVRQNAAPAGASDTQSAPVQGLVTIPVPLGQWAFGVWWPFPRVYEFQENTILLSTANNATGNQTGNSLISGFFGWLMPEQEIPNE